MVLSDKACVYRDAERHTCIVLSLHELVEFIPMHPLMVTIEREGLDRFQRRYTLYETYPVKRAAELYLYTETFKQFSAEAREALQRIVDNPVYNYDASQFKPIERSKKEIVMSEAQTADAPVKKAAPAGKKTPARRVTDKKPAAKKAAAPVKKAVAAKKVAAKKGAAVGGNTKYAPEAVITVMAKENPKREGSKAHKEFELYKKAKTVADYVRLGGTLGYLNYDASAGFIKVKG